MAGDVNEKWYSDREAELIYRSLCQQHKLVKWYDPNKTYHTVYELAPKEYTIWND